jgi:hypothetical protein
VRGPRFLAAASLIVSTLAQAAPALLCHYTYGGEETTLRVAPDQPAYAVEPVAVGSYFLFKVIYQTQPADLAGVRIYVYADREPVPVPVHQVNFPYPLRAQPQAGYGFTGQHWVYEPVRDGEMEYWCELQGQGVQP